MQALIRRWCGLERAQRLIAGPYQSPLEFVQAANREYALEIRVVNPPAGPFESTIFVSTHHSGAVDFLATYPTLQALAPNLKIVVNRELSVLSPLGSVFIGVHTLSRGHLNVAGTKTILQVLQSGGNILVYPAGKVAALESGAPKDLAWQEGMARLFVSHAKQVIPIYVDAKNSRLFYLLRKIFPRLGLLVMLWALTGRKREPIHVCFGTPIPTSTFTNVSSREIMERLRQETYALEPLLGGLR